jgi:hypothetical protein
MSLAYAENVRRHTGRPVLYVAPLGVTFQVEDEAAKFGVEAAISRDGRVAAGDHGHQLRPPAPLRPGRLRRPRLRRVERDQGTSRRARGAGDGVRAAAGYRLLATATAAPNDYTELGTSSEALGYLGYVDMLNRFFINDRKTGAPGAPPGALAEGGQPLDSGGGGGEEWRFKGHAEVPFWRWVASWARALRRPSDLGYPDDGFALPPLIQREHGRRAHDPPGDALRADGRRAARGAARRSGAPSASAASARPNSWRTPSPASPGATATTRATSWRGSSPARSRCAARTSWSPRRRRCGPSRAARSASSSPSPRSPGTASTGSTATA